MGPDPDQAADSPVCEHMEMSVDSGDRSDAGGESDRDAGSDHVIITHGSADDIAESHDCARQQECGVLGCRPRAIQPCASLPVFTVVMSCLGLFGSINFSYYTSVISHIEKQYGLSSSVTGVVKNIDNVGFLITVLIFSHFCRKANKPRLFAITNLIASVAICCFALPYWIYPPEGELFQLSSHPHHVTNNNTATHNQSTVKDDRYEFCDGDFESNWSEEDCYHSSGSNVGALVILVCTGLIQGMSRSPQATLGLTYMDDTSKDASPKYFGFIFGSRTLATILGFLLGAWTSTIYVDLSDPGISQADPRWVGAWWIGFLICALLTVVWCIPLILFPVKIPAEPQRYSCCHKHNLVLASSDDTISANENGVAHMNGQAHALLDHHGNNNVTTATRKGKKRADKSALPNGDFMDNLKDMPRTLRRLVSNPIFLFMMLGASCNMSLMGFITFLSKYIETQFRQTTSMANIYTGCISAFTWSIGPIVSGKLIQKFNITARQSILLIFCIQLVSVAGFATMLLMSCPQSEWAGDPFGENTSLSLGCNQECGCDPDMYTPVCGDDSLTYYNPCWAGCTTTGDNNTDQSFINCGCTEHGMATVGRCDPDCDMFVPYLVVLGLTSFVTSMYVVPLMTILLRCVEENDKSLSVALGTAFVNFAAFPAPIIFGLVVDSTCLVKQTTCDDSGACLFHEPNALRLRLHGLELGIKIAALIFFSIALVKSRTAVFHGDGETVEVIIDEDSDAESAKRRDDEANRLEGEKEIVRARTRNISL